MQLKSFGCSFIFGNDLPDDNNGNLYGTVSRYTWPSLVAKQLGYDYSCYAYPGIGNLRILDRLLLQINADIQPALFVINWTWIDRFDHQDADLKWHTIMPVDTSQTANFYYRNLHSQYRDKLTTLMAIKLAIDTLKAKNLPFIMTYMDELIFETQWHAGPGIYDLQEYVRPYLTKFDDQTFLDWGRDNGFPISPTLHPLEQAHQEAANYIINRIESVTKH
jgi:hypothetical protein